MVTILEQLPAVMKNKTTTILTAGFLFTSNILPATPTIGSHLERGVELMQDEATLQDAILHFEKVLQKQNESRKLAAEALFLLAQCQLKLGDKEKAQASLTKLSADWPADNKWVMKAATLFPNSINFRAAPWASGEMLTHSIRVDDQGEVFDAGHVFSVILASEEKGAKTWTSWVLSSSAISDFTTLEFADRTFLPLNGHQVSGLDGHLIIESDDSPGFKMRKADADFHHFVWSPLLEDQDAEGCYYMHQHFDLIRVFPDEIGATTTISIASDNILQETVKIAFKAIEHTTIKVPAGEFDCVRYDSEEMGSLWVERTGARRLVKNVSGPMTIELVASENGWTPEKGLGVERANKAEELNFGVPEGMIKIADPVGESFHYEQTGTRVGLFDTKLRVWGGMIERLSMEGKAPSRAALQEMLKQGIPKEKTDPVAETATPTLKPTGAPTTKDEVPSEVINRPESSPLVDRMIEQFNLRGAAATESRKIRKLSFDGDTAFYSTRLKIKNGELEHERTVLFEFDEDTMTVMYFDHPSGNGEQALSLLKNILKGL